MRKHLANLDWNNVLRNKTAAESLTILKYDIESAIDQFVPLKKNKENGLERNTFQKKLLEKIGWRLHKLQRGTKCSYNSNWTINKKL